MLVFKLKRGDECGFGASKLSSNYILKFESGKAPCIAVNPFFCMTLAKLVGVDVANVELTRIGKTRTRIIERFNRTYIEARDGVSFPRLLNIKTIDTVITNLKLTQWMLFNLPTLNYDAHGKF